MYPLLISCTHHHRRHIAAFYGAGCDDDSSDEQLMRTLYMVQEVVQASKLSLLEGGQLTERLVACADDKAPCSCDIMGWDQQSQSITPA